MSAVTVFVVAHAEQLPFTGEVDAFYLSEVLGCTGFSSITLSCHWLLACASKPPVWVVCLLYWRLSPLGRFQQLSFLAGSFALNTEIHQILYSKKVSGTAQLTLLN